MKQEASILLSSFYTHQLHVEDPCVDLLHIPNAMQELCGNVITALLETDCREIVALIKGLDFRFSIKKADIPQFSCLNDSFAKVPFLVRDCGIDDITYLQMGFMLGSGPRKDGADRKYGENHAKTAAQMGLCSIRQKRIYSSFLGLKFTSLPIEKREKLYPKLALFMPLMFNVFANDAGADYVDESVKILSLSTQKRRLPNVWTLINVINTKLPYELQVNRY